MVRPRMLGAMFAAWCATGAWLAPRAWAQGASDATRVPVVGTMITDGWRSAPIVRPAPPPSAPPAAPFAALGASAAALRDSIVAFARAQLGRRYVWGGDSPQRGFDCSGLTRYLLAHFDVRLPRTAREQARTGAAVGRDEDALLPGDLLTFGRGRISHVGIYVGNGRFIHASSAAGRVIESQLDRPPSRRIKPWRGARRLIAARDTTATASAPGAGPAAPTGGS